MKRIRLGRQTDDPGFARTLGRLLSDHNATQLPTNADLHSSSLVRQADADQAVALWDEAQRRYGTGLEGTL